MVAVGITCIAYKGFSPRPDKNISTHLRVNGVIECNPLSLYEKTNTQSMEYLVEGHSQCVTMTRTSMQQKSLGTDAPSFEKRRN